MNEAQDARTNSQLGTHHDSTAVTLPWTDVLHKYMDSRKAVWESTAATLEQFYQELSAIENEPDGPDALRCTELYRSTVTQLKECVSVYSEIEDTCNAVLDGRGTYEDNDKALASRIVLAVGAYRQLHAEMIGRLVSGSSTSASYEAYPDPEAAEKTRVDSVLKPLRVVMEQDERIGHLIGLQDSEVQDDDRPSEGPSPSSCMILLDPSLSAPGCMQLGVTRPPDDADKSALPGIEYCPFSSTANSEARTDLLSDKCSILGLACKDAGHVLMGKILHAGRSVLTQVSENHASARRRLATVALNLGTAELLPDYDTVSGALGLMRGARHAESSYQCVPIALKSFWEDFDRKRQIEKAQALDELESKKDILLADTAVNLIRRHLHIVMSATDPTKYRHCLYGFAYSDDKHSLDAIAPDGRSKEELEAILGPIGPFVTLGRESGQDVDRGILHKVTGNLNKAVDDQRRAGVTNMESWSSVAQSLGPGLPPNFASNFTGEYLKSVATYLQELHDKQPSTFAQ